MKLILIVLSALVMSSAFSRQHLKETSEDTKAKIKECHDSAGFEKGKKPNREAREKFKECAKSKGMDTKFKHMKKNKMKDQVRDLDADLIAE